MVIETESASKSKEDADYPYLSMSSVTGDKSTA